jgi:cysteine desulfurase
MIYLDNAATTPIHPKVIKVIHEKMTIYGNPSSTHTIGREAKALVEQARKNIAKTFKVNPQEIVFTSGGSEANNLILWNAVTQLGVKEIITSRLEHHSVLQTIGALVNQYGIGVRYVKLKKNGQVDLDYLEKKISGGEGKKLVSLMYVNNETGGMLPLQEVANLCKIHDVLFHSDTVQGIGHYDIDLSHIPVDFISASAHKFHGPKGVGFAFIRKGVSLKPILHGGGQEHGMRAGTENIHSIVGLDIALQESRKNLIADTTQIWKLKQYFIDRLEQGFPGIVFNAAGDNKTISACHVLNVRFPKEDAMLLFKLDMNGLACSGGSACQSGSNKGSHVLSEIIPKYEQVKTSVRFSFSVFTTKEEIDQTIAILKNTL